MKRLFNKFLTLSYRGVTLRKVYDKILGFRATETARKIILDYIEKDINIKNVSQALNAIVEAYGSSNYFRAFCPLFKGNVYSEKPHADKYGICQYFRTNCDNCGLNPYSEAYEGT